MLVIVFLIVRIIVLLIVIFLSPLRLCRSVCLSPPLPLFHAISPPEGIRFAVERGGRVMICDEMGLGKTMQAIAVCWYYRAEASRA